MVVWITGVESAGYAGHGANYCPSSFAIDSLGIEVSFFFAGAL